MNTVGTPMVSASPCSEWKISVILSRVALTNAPCRVRRLLFGNALETIRSQFRGVRPRVLLGDVSQGRLGRRILLLRILGIAELQQRIGRLARIGPFFEHGAEGSA